MIEEKLQKDAVMFVETCCLVEGVALALLKMPFRKRDDDTNIYIIGDGENQPYVHYKGWGCLPAKSITDGENFYFYAGELGITLREKPGCTRIITLSCSAKTKRIMAIKLAMLQKMAKRLRQGKLGPRWPTVLSAGEAIELDDNLMTHVVDFLHGFHPTNLAARWFALRNWRTYYMALWGEPHSYVAEYCYLDLNDKKKMIDAILNFADSYKNLVERTAE